MKNVCDLVEDIKLSLPAANVDRVREIFGPFTEDDANLMRQILNSSKKSSYELKYHFNTEEKTSYVYVRRLR